MKTADLVARALRLIQVIDPLQSVKAQDMATTILALNGMMARIEADVVPMGWSPVSNSSDDLPLADEMVTPIAFLLAVEVAPEFGVTPLPKVEQRAAQGMAALERDAAVANPIRPILAVPIPTYQNGKTLNGESFYVG
jgi:hypothetical protein